MWQTWPNHLMRLCLRRENMVRMSALLSTALFVTSSLHEMPRMRLKQHIWKLLSLLFCWECMVQDSLQGAHHTTHLRRQPLIVIAGANSPTSITATLHNLPFCAWERSITGRLLLPVLCQMLLDKAGVSSPGQDDVEDQLLPKQQAPLSMPPI